MKRIVIFEARLDEGAIYVSSEDVSNDRLMARVNELLQGDAEDRASFWQPPEGAIETLSRKAMFLQVMDALPGNDPFKLVGRVLDGLVITRKRPVC